MKLEVTQSCHNMPCLQAHDLPLEVLRIIRAAVTCNYIDDERYKLGRQAGAFLQGYDERNGWALVEFWQPNYQAFADLVNQLINDAAQIALHKQIIEAEKEYAENNR